MAMVTGEIDKCIEYAGGVCDASCSSKCASLHPGGFGVCKPPPGSAPGVGQEACWCSYQCEQKICEVGLPDFGVCNDRQCDAACAAKYPGKAAQGSCIGIIWPYFNCHCRIYC